MSEHVSRVLWVGSQAVMTLPEHVDSSNADEVREQLLVMINRGAAVIIADLTATVSCDYSGADALVRAYQRAIANGIQLRVAVGSNVVRRVLSINGLDRLVPVYPTVEAALAAGAPRRVRRGETTVPVSPATAGRAGQATAATPAQAGRAEDLLDSVVNKIFGAALTLQATTDTSTEVTAARISEALRRLDEAVQEIRQHLVTGQDGMGQPDLSGGSAQAMDQRVALAAKRTEMLRERLIQTAYALRSEAAGTATLLERRGDLVTPPGEADYPTRIKRWRALAELAEKMARRWEQSTGMTP